MPVDSWDCPLEPTGDESRFAVRLGMRQVKGLTNRDAAAIVAARAERPYASIDDLWRRAGVPVAALTRLAEADAFLPAFGLGRREALWAIRPLRDEPLPLFAAAAAREAETLPEAIEPAVALRPMTEGREVVEDYGHIGLSLRAHPISFLRADLAQRRIVSCAVTMRRWLETAGVVLVRQRPGSAKEVLFATIEDETGITNVVYWAKTFEKYRRVLLSSGMLGIRGRVQREGKVVHLVAHHLTDLTPLLASVGHRNGGFPLPHGRGDEMYHGSPHTDPRGAVKVPAPRNLGDGYGHIDEIKVRTRDFR